MSIEPADMQHIEKSWNKAADTIGDTLRAAQDYAYCLGYNRAMDEIDEAKEQARRDATEEVAKAHKRGWEQGKRECVNIADNLFKYESGYYHYKEDVGDAIAAMEYGGKANEI